MINTTMHHQRMRAKGRIPLNKVVEGSQKGEAVGIVQTKDKSSLSEIQKHCEVFGFAIPESECTELTKLGVLAECDECDGKPKKLQKVEGKEMSKTSEGNGKGKRKYTMSAAALLARQENGGKRKVKLPPINKESITPQPDPIVLSQGTPGSELKDPLQIVIDFSEHPDLHKTLITLAKNEMRTPAVQALFLLKHGDFKTSCLQLAPYKG